MQPISDESTHDTQKVKSKRPRPAYDPTSDIVRPRDLTAATGLSPVTIWRMRGRGEFPQPIRLSAGAVGWLRADVDTWLAARAGAGRG